ncbi:hypothetical protein BaRGS_00033363, partial [Batillaria attramentaria]
IGLGYIILFVITACYFMLSGAFVVKIRRARANDNRNLAVAAGSAVLMVVVATGDGAVVVAAVKGNYREDGFVQGVLQFVDLLCLLIEPGKISCTRYVD